ncbi:MULTISPECIES: hypothetical protein [Providencia]|uniref:hypothetical protein n=1 Tax=Providencia TaxID=586 RepID=UPI000CE67696|nr:MULTISPECIES: hypothetical protein [Providencia]AVE43699.1 hypothetical protein AM353_18680 [Providencia stuartii]EMF0916287.1 hypothetical protein [Providencia stuartii]EMF0919855.1 hypothetical protein [Providencia stuartii]MBN5557078.1 hypothetical protein [Providencia stuartii]MBQ0458840.1 hypothetical protein [Providencia stuartii]
MDGLIVITFSIIIGFIALVLILPVIILSLFDKSREAKKHSVTKYQREMEKIEKPEVIAKQIDNEERMTLIIFSIVILIVLVVTIYILFCYR